MELHEKLNISERHIRRAIIDAFGIECPERTIRGWLDGRHPLGNCKGFKKCPETAYLTTAFLGDGTTAISYAGGHTKYVLSLRVSDYDFAKYVGYAAAVAVNRKKAYKPIPIKEPYQRYGRKQRWQIIFCNKLLYEVITASKDEPWIAYEVLELYKYPEYAISGFFDAEESVSQDIRAENKNYELLLMIQHLLNNLEVHSKIYQRKDRPGYYTLVIYRRQAIINFYKKVSLKIRRKQKKLEKLITKYL